MMMKKTVLACMLLPLLGCAGVTSANSVEAYFFIDMDESVGKTRDEFREIFRLKTGETVHIRGKLLPDFESSAGRIGPCSGVRDASEFIPEEGSILSEEASKRFSEARRSGDFGWHVNYEFAAFEGGEYIAAIPSETLNAKPPVLRASIKNLEDRCVEYTAKITKEPLRRGEEPVSNVLIYNVYE